VFEPFYENYGGRHLVRGEAGVPTARAARSSTRRLAAAFSARTRAIMYAPEQPDGPGAVRGASSKRSPSCAGARRYAVTDEIYEQSLRGEHIPIATLDGMASAPSTISGASKTFKRHRLAHRHDRGPVGRDRRDPQGA